MKHLFTKTARRFLSLIVAVTVIFVGVYNLNDIYISAAAQDDPAPDSGMVTVSDKADTDIDVDDTDNYYNELALEDDSLPDVDEGEAGAGGGMPSRRENNVDYTGTKTGNLNITAAALTGNPTITIGGGVLKIGAVLTADIADLNVATGLTYQWKANGTNAGTNSSSYTVQGSDAGKTITVTVTASGDYTGSVTSGATTVVPYTIVVNGYNYNNSDDSVTAQTIYKNVGEAVGITYTLADTAITNKLLLGHGIIVTTPGTNTVMYTINPDHATSGVITFTPVFIHQSTLTDANVTVTAPVSGKTPQSTVARGAYYIGTITWNPAHSAFKGSTEYTAAVTLTAQDGASFDSDFTLTVNNSAATRVLVSGTTAIFTYTFPITSAKSLSYISVETQPAKTVYYSGDQLDLSGLVVKLYYNDLSTEDIPYADLTDAMYSIDSTAVTSGVTILKNTAHDSKAVAITYNGQTTDTITLTVNKLTVLLGTITGNEGRDTVTLATEQKDVGETVSIAYTLDNTAIVNRLALGYGIMDITTPGSGAVNYTVNASHAVGGVITFSPVFTHPNILTEADVTITAPVKGAVPQTNIPETACYTGQVTWNGNPSVFLGDTVYTSAVTLTAQGGAVFDSSFIPMVDGGMVSGITVAGNGGSVTFTVTYPATLAKTVSGISIKTQPNLIYVAGDKLDLSALAVTVTYDDTATEDIAYNKAGVSYIINSTAVASGTTVLNKAAHDGKAVTIIYSGKTAETDSLTVYAPLSVQISVTDITDTSARISYSAYDGSDSVTSRLQVRSGSSWVDISGASSPYTASLLTPKTSYEYRVWTKDIKTSREYTKSVTFRTAAADIPTGVTVSGKVTDASKPSGISLTIKHGNTIIASVTVTGSGTYNFSFSNIPDGTYNLVTDNGRYKVTQAITVSGRDVEVDIALTAGNTQSVVEIVGQDTPPAAVGGLPELFGDTVIYTIEDADVVKNGGTVEIKFVVEKKDGFDVASDAAKIKSAAAGQMIGLYLDLSVIKSLFDNTGALLDETKLTHLGSNLVTITFTLPDELKGKAGLKIYRVHNDIAEALTSAPNQDNETAGISGDIVTLEACRFSTYAITYTPKKAASSSGNGLSSNSSDSAESDTDISTDWIEVSEAKTMVKEALDKGLDYARSCRAAITGIRKKSLLALAEAGMRYQHDTIVSGVVQVRVYIDDPGKAAKDILVSGCVKGKNVDRAKARFEKWFPNKIAVISMDQQGDFGMKVQIAAKVNLNSMNVNNLYFYSYDKKTDKYVLIETEYRIDVNGYLHFATILAGDIIVSDGPLSNETEEKLTDLSVQTAHQDPQSPKIGGDSAPPTQLDIHNSAGGDNLYGIDTGDSLKLEDWDNLTADGTLEIDPNGPVRQDVYSTSLKDGRPGILLSCLLGGIAVVAAMMLWAVIPRKKDPLAASAKFE